MKRFATLIVLGICALPTLGSAPARATKSKPKPRIVVPNQVPAQPAMQMPRTMPQPSRVPKVLEMVLFPDRALAELLFDRTGLPAILRVKRLWAESKDL